MPREIDAARLQHLLAQDLSQREIARQLGIPRSTLQDHLKRQPRAPVQRPVQTADTDVVSSVDTGAGYMHRTGAEQGLDTGAVQRLNHIEAELQTLRQFVHAVMERLDRLPVSTPVQITALPPLPKGKAVRWNLWIHEAIREEIARLAAERDLSPSQLVQELLWRALRGEP
jgi:hypothetical protein